MQRDSIPIVIPPRDSDPSVSFFCADPDGHHVQLYFDPAGR